MKLTYTLLSLSLFLSSYACAKDVTFDFQTPPQQHVLIPGLFEISGLAIASDTTVYAHNDEHAIIYEIDVSTGEALSAFAIGTPTIAADFEGIATNDDRIYVITSGGILYESLIGKHQDRMRFNAYDTGVGYFCEVEGLTIGPAHPAGGQHFLILCKSPLQEDLKDRLTLYSWNLNDRIPVQSPWLSLDGDEILTKKEQKKFRPSGIEWLEQTNRLVIISAKNNQYIQLSETGDVIAKAVLSPNHHPQAEGLAILPSGQLIIADEGSKLKPGQISVYQPKN